jgi:hypothetical protein
VSGLVSGQPGWRREHINPPDVGSRPTYFEITDKSCHAFALLVRSNTDREPATADPLIQHVNGD